MKRTSSASNLAGHYFGRLRAIFRYDEKTQHGGSATWFCECLCGRFKVISVKSLKSGDVRSCGCLSVERERVIKNRRLISIWKNMKSRCNYVNKKCYKYYGERGVHVCEEWLSYNNFSHWAIESGYQDDLTLDRKDGNGNYEPSNCRWVTRQEQSNNTKTNRILQYNGKSMSIAGWARETGIKEKTIWARIFRLHWDEKRTLTTSPHQRIKK